MGKEVSKNYYNIPSKLNKDEVLIYYSLCENTNFTLDEYEGREKFECFCSLRTLSEDTLLSTRIVSKVLKKLEECGYIELISKGKPPKTPSKYKLTYAENIKKSVTLNIPLSKTLSETMQSIENKGINDSSKTLSVTMSETLRVTPSKDISKDKSNNIYSPLDSETYVNEINKELEEDLLKKIKSKYSKELIKDELDKLKNKGLSKLDLLTELEKNLKSKKKEIKEECSKDIKTIFDCWNSKGIIKHKNLSPVIKKAIEKVLKDYKLDEIVQAINTYSEILNSQFYFNYKWSLSDFLNRKNGISTFMKEGSNKVNYEEWKKGEKKNGNTKWTITKDRGRFTKGSEEINYKPEEYKGPSYTEEDYKRMYESGELI